MRAKENRSGRALHVSTGILLLLGGALLLSERLPTRTGGSQLHRGDAVPSDLEVRSLAAGDTLPLFTGVPTLVLVYRSTCPACAENLPGWIRLTEELSGVTRIFAVPLEPRGPGLDYARRHLAPALAVRPLDPERFLRVFDVRGVPATIFVGADGALRFRRNGVLDAERIEELLTLARGGAGDGPRAGPQGSPASDSGGSVANSTSGKNARR